MARKSFVVFTFSWFFHNIIRPQEYWSWKETVWSTFCTTSVELLPTKSRSSCNHLICDKYISMRISMSYIWMQNSFFLFPVKLTCSLCADTRMQIGDYALLLLRCLGKFLLRNICIWFLNLSLYLWRYLWTGFLNDGKPIKLKQGQ